MLAPRSRVRAGRAITFTIASLCLNEGLIRPVSAQLIKHTEQGAEPPTPGHRPWDFEMLPLTAGLGPLMVAPGPGVHGFDTRLYVLLQRHHKIVQVDPSGVVTRFTRLPRHATEGCTPLTFDVKGNYGHGLLFGGTGERIGRVNASGSVSYLRRPRASGPRRAMPATRGLTCDPFGAFEGRLFRADVAGAIFEVDVRGRMLLVTDGRTTTVARDGSRAMLFSPHGEFGTALYVADQIGRRILRMSPDHVPGDDAPVWRSTADLQIEPSGLAISSSGPFGTDVMYVVDEHADRVVSFAADGTFLGTFVSGLEDRSSIELPQTGLFRHMMVIVAPDSISIVRRIDRPGYEHQPGPRGDLDRDLDVDELDLHLLLENLDCVGPGCDGDLNNDGTTDVVDIDAFLQIIGAVRTERVPPEAVLSEDVLERTVRPAG